MENPWGTRVNALAVDVVVVSHFGSEDVDTLVASLRAQSDARWRLMIVDNSTDRHELVQLRQHGADDVTVVAAGHNAGYLGGARFALQMGARRSSNWLVVCNADVVFAPDFVHRLLGQDADHVVAPAIISSVSGRDQNPYLVERPRRRDAIRWRLEFRWVPVARVVLWAAYVRARLSRTRGRQPLPAGTHIYAPHGSCFVFPPVYFEQGGELDHWPFLFAEELTVAEECRRLGVPVVYEPDLRLVHREHASTGVWRSREMLEAQRDAVEYAINLLNRHR